MLELRRLLEAFAVGLACQRASRDDRQRLTAMAERLTHGNFTLEEYADTVKGTHELIVTSAHNTYLADAIAPLQGLSRRFWLAHVIDVDKEIKAGAHLHTAILRAILAGNAARAEAASHQLNDYLVEFSYATVHRWDTCAPEVPFRTGPIDA